MARHPVCARESPFLRRGGTQATGCVDRQKPFLIVAARDILAAMSMITRRTAIGAFAGGAFAQTPRPEVVKVTILSTMLSGPFTGEWGFAAMVEIDGKRTLFDTGNRP